MTAPVAPMEARCAHCLDTGSLSKQMDGALDCHYCEATTQRIALRGHLAQFTGWPQNDVTAWAAYLFAQRQAPPIAPNEYLKSLDDMVIFGTGFMQGSKHVPYAEVFALPSMPVAPQPSAEAFARFWDAVEARNHEAQPAQQVEAVGQRVSDEMVEAAENVGDLYRLGQPEIIRSAIRAALSVCPQLEAQQAGDVALKAARYDWLRQDAKDRYVAIFIEPDTFEALTGEELDAAVDALMAKEKA